tara:strand:- start:27289 stop:27993 length:705 start_codon:yes stop_codon:yes gene_type:complete
MILVGLMATLNFGCKQDKVEKDSKKEPQQEVKLEKSVMPKVALENGMKIIFSKEFSLAGHKFSVEGHGYGEFCDYETLVFSSEGKKIGTFSNLCGRKLDGLKNKSQGSKYFALVGLNSSGDKAFYFREEPSNYVFKTTLLKVSPEEAKVHFSKEIDGYFEDYNKDGLTDIVKIGGRGEPQSGGTSYDPYLVYKQTNADKIDFEIDEDLSKKLSRENNYEWHGPKYDESVVVDSQ